MAENFPADYLAGLPAGQQRELARVNGPGLAALREYLKSRRAMAFLGAGVSAPLYPLWDELIGELVDAASGRLTDREAETCRALAHESPGEVVEIVRRGLGTGAYREVLRQVLRVRTDPETGRSWTPVQELVCRCDFKAVVTTNYDPGIVDARMRVRTGASATGFTTWEDELGLDRWRNEDVFGDAELPVLFAHGQCNRPDSVVLATTEYRRAYAGKLPHVLAHLVDGGHLVWIGFSFADQRIAAILREIAETTGTRVDPGGAPRHVAVMAWDPVAEGNDPGILARRAEIGYGAHVVLYPAPRGDHSALVLLLSALADERFPPAGDLKAEDEPAGSADGEAAAVGAGVPVTWVPGEERLDFFTGRAEELARLDRWAADPEVRLIGVTAWGGAGKTTLVTRWIQTAGWASRRSGLRGVFGWSFYADPSAEHWAQGLLEWAGQNLGARLAGRGRLAAAVLALLRAVPLLLVLDGLEVVQEGPAGDGFGQLLDGTVREALAGACQQRHAGLVVLTSRFPFADLETFDGGSARMLDVPPFTPAEGAELLAAAGGDWLGETERRDLVAAVDGHALAVGVLAGLLADHLPTSDLAALREELAAAARTSARVGRLLGFYADRLNDADRYLLAAVSLFARPVSAEALLALAGHEVFGGCLAGWAPADVEAAVTGRLGGLASWHPDGTISAHPLVRDTFRSLALGAAETAAETSLTGIPEGQVTNRADALRVVEAVELLLDAGQWEPADDLYSARADGGRVLQRLPAARLGQRAESAFVATAARRRACETQLGRNELRFYLAGVGLHATNAGDLVTAREHLLVAVRQARDMGDRDALSRCLFNLAWCLGETGEVREARDAAEEAVICAEGNLSESSDGRAELGWLAGLNGDTRVAEQHFIVADQTRIADLNSGHMYSSLGVRWAEWLVRTGRRASARSLTERNLEVCGRNAWNEDAAMCERVLGRIDLASGDVASAGEHFLAAAECFREGDYLIELATTLVDMAEQARSAGDLGAADEHATEAMTIAAPRGLVPVQSAALAARARIFASQAATDAGPDHILQGRDAADAALRLATRHRLAWHELDAMRAHGALDQAEGADRGWNAKADALHARLVPPGLDPDPLATVERLVAEQKAAGQDNDEAGGDG